MDTNKICPKNREELECLRAQNQAFREQNGEMDKACNYGAIPGAVLGGAGGGVFGKFPGLIAGAVGGGALGCVISSGSVRQWNRGNEAIDGAIESTKEVYEEHVCSPVPDAPFCSPKGRAR